MNDLRTIRQRLHEFCAARDWRGYDPYDALNSPLARWFPGKQARQAWTQLHRRCPVNLRPLCGIRPAENAKALALFALGNGDPKLLARLAALRNADGGWGYPFPWQSRAFFAPRGTSNLICTALAAKALAVWNGVSAKHRVASDPNESTVHETAIPSARQFIERHLLRERDGERWITYIAGSETQVHNVNLIGAALLGRADCLEFSVKRQRPDGSWWYGEAPNQHWIDNYHTGYNLVALRETGLFPEAAARGFAYWDRTFWTPAFAPRYSHDHTYPHDVHCCAQGVLTYLAYGELAKANAVAQWAVTHLWDNRGFFWYQRGRWWTHRVNYMRWAQAWMYSALAKLIAANETRR